MSPTALGMFWHRHWADGADGAETMGGEISRWKVNIYRRLDRERETGTQYLDLSWKPLSNPGVQNSKLGWREFVCLFACACELNQVSEMPRVLWKVTKKKTELNFWAQPEDRVVLCWSISDPLYRFIWSHLELNSVKCVFFVCAWVALLLVIDYTLWSSLIILS